MKKFILIIVTIAFFIYPSICLSSYLIELKNGSTFITNHYWEKKGQIKFYFRGGVVGIKRDFIERITESDVPYYEPTVESRALERESDKKSEKGIEEEERKEKTEKETKKIDVDYFKTRNAALTEKIDEAKKQFKKANAEGDKLTQDKTKKEYLELRKQLSELKRELIKKNNGELPEWW